MKYPKCDNCGKPITIRGKFTKEEGLIKYVHMQYNPNTGKCKP